MTELETIQTECIHKMQVMEWKKRKKKKRNKGLETLFFFFKWTYFLECYVMHETLQKTWAQWSNMPI